MKKYYEAYEQRYLDVHKQQLQWSSNQPSKIVLETIQKYSISKTNKILEIGCGEGRDVIHLLNLGFNVLGSDISKEAIDYCKKISNHNNFEILDCIHGIHEYKYDFIYSISVIHMFVLDEDRHKFYQFIKTHLNKNGIALICSMGNGIDEFQSDISKAFELGLRIHQDSGKEMMLTQTSCRVVNFNAFHHELNQYFEIIESGLTSMDPDFSQIMYAIVKDKDC